LCFVKVKDEEIPTTIPTEQSKVRRQNTETLSMRSEHMRYDVPNAATHSSYSAF
jgi:hypothetical protein